MKNVAIILASGIGERSGLNIPKQFAVIGGKTILEHSVETFETCPSIHEIIVVANPLFFVKTNDILKSCNYSKLTQIIPGGKTRQESSRNGVNAVKDEDANVLIHDAVRPFVTHKIINDCIDALKSYSAVNVAIESSDTIIEVDDNNIIKHTLNRKYLRRCQTPQCFKLSVIKEAHRLAEIVNLGDITDDCGLILRYKLCDVYVVQGSTENIKITYPQDIQIAEILSTQK